MEGKKISFGFMKTKKAIQPVLEEKKEYIECVEEKSIKVVGGEAVEEKAPLIIPMKPNTLITAEKLKEIALKVESAIEEQPLKTTDSDQSEEKPADNETLDQMAVRELLQDAKKDVKVDNTELTVPVPSQPVLDGQKESTLEDYEAVPIQDFGMAMLRGMGWTPGKDKAKYKPPELRPKGLGLGADKVVKANQKKSANKKDEDLAIVKNALVKITTGKYSGYYGKVVSLDEDNGRVMVDITVKKETVSLSEFMMQPVSKAEFDKESKVINADSYQEYKKTEISQKPSKTAVSPKNKARDTQSGQKSNENDRDYLESNRRREEDHKTDRENDKKDKSNGRNRDKSARHKRDSSSSEDRSRHKRKDKKNTKRDSSNSSEDKRNHKSRRHHHTSSESEDSDSYKKEKRHKERDIDKKRKGKKKRRDRSRSPHYRKHRK